MLRPENGRVGAVDIASTRPLGTARIFVGRPVAEMTETIGRVFSLCGKAQSVAALRASEAALGIAPDPGVEAARDLVRMAEMLTQTAMRLALHWPRELDLPIRPELVRACLSAEQQLERLVPGEGWKIPGAGVGRPSDAAGELLGALDTEIVGASITEELEAALAARGLEGFGALPEGVPPEAGALARNWDAPQVAEIRARHGAGLAARLAASREDFLGLTLAMIAELANVTPAERRPSLRASGSGAATVETARGPLTHCVTIADGIVAACETAAPTEANFTAGGPVAAGLTGGPVDPVAAELHVLAIDPCVGCTVEVADA